MQGDVEVVLCNLPWVVRGEIVLHVLEYDVEASDDEFASDVVTHEVIWVFAVDETLELHMLCGYGVVVARGHVEDPLMVLVDPVSCYEHFFSMSL